MGQLVKLDNLPLDWTPQTGPAAHTFDLSVPADRKALFSATMKSDMTFEDMVKERIAVRHIMVHRVPRVSPETGEIRDGLRVAILTPDGVVISGGSETVLRSLLLAIQIADRKAPFDPPLQFTVRSEDRKAGPGKWIWLEWEE